jgi:hypothetical protein
LATAASSGKYSETIIPPLGEIRLGGIAYVGVLMVSNCLGTSERNYERCNPWKAASLMGFR